MGELERAREEYEQATWTLQHKVTDTVLGTNALNAADALITALEAALAAVERERDRLREDRALLCEATIYGVGLEDLFPNGEWPDGATDYLIRLARWMTLHDEDGKLWPDCEPLALVERAITNLRRAHDELLLGERGVQSWPRRYLVDGLNDSALALSLLPDRNPGQGGAS